MRQRQVIREHMEEHGANEPSQHLLDHRLFTYKLCVTTFSSLSCVNAMQYIYCTAVGI